MSNVGLIPFVCFAVFLLRLFNLGPMFAEFAIV